MLNPEEEDASDVKSVSSEEPEGPTPSADLADRTIQQFAETCGVFFVFMLSSVLSFLRHQIFTSSSNKNKKKEAATDPLRWIGLGAGVFVLTLWVYSLVFQGRFCEALTLVGVACGCVYHINEWFNAHPVKPQ